MPILNDKTQKHTIAGSNYGFSGKRIDQLGASEYTLVTISADASGSVFGFAKEIEEAIQDVVRACSHSPRADNLLLRFTRFNGKLHEVHGFKPLMECHLDSYRDCLQPGGSTALYDAAYNGIESIRRYGHSLTQHHFEVNGILFVITDGDDNVSKMTANSVKKAMSDAVKGEAMQSMVSVLVGVNVQSQSLSYSLKSFSKKAGFTNYIQLDHANETTLASLADFVSKSIVMQSTALNTGQGSTVLTF